jgi:hypothetical protein
MLSSDISLEKLMRLQQACGFAFLACTSVALAQPSFTAMGRLNGAEVPTQATAISADGSVVVGSSGFDSLNTQAVIWRSGSWAALADVTGGSDYCTAKAINSNGSVIAGIGTGVDGNVASAIADYFAPLNVWLQEQNRGHQCGWSAA